MNRVVRSGNARTNNHRGTVTLSPPLNGMPSEYAVLVTAVGAVLAERGAHVIGYELDAENNLKGFEVYTDEPIGDFSWIVVQLLPVENIEQLRALPPGMVPRLTVLGYFVPEDGGGGIFYWDDMSNDPDNKGTIIQPNAGGKGRWKRLGADTACDIQVRWFGAKGDGTLHDDHTDDTDAIKRAIEYTGASEIVVPNVEAALNASVVFGKGIFLYSETIIIPPGNRGITLIGSREAAAQQGSYRPATVLRWIGKQGPTFSIQSTFTTFRDMAVENGGDASYFANVEPSGAGRVNFYGVSCQSGGSAKPFKLAFIKTPVIDYSRIERCEFSAAAPVIIDLNGTYDPNYKGSGTTTYTFIGNVLDTYFDTDIFRLKNGPFEILKIVNNTFNAQPNSSGEGDTFYQDLGLIYTGSGLTVVNSMDIDKDALAAGSTLGNLIFRDNEYDDSAYDISDDPPKFSHLNDNPPTLSPDETKRLNAELQRLAGVRMLKLKHCLNLDLANNNLQGNSCNQALIELTDSFAHAGKNFATEIGGPIIQTLDSLSRVFFRHNNITFGNVEGLINKNTSAGIVKMMPSDGSTDVFIFGQLGDPGGMTTFQFDIPGNKTYTIYVAEWQWSPPRNGYMTRGQKVLVVVRNVGGGSVEFSSQFKTSGTFTTPSQGTSRAILFEYVGTVDYPNDPQTPDNLNWNGYMVERWSGGSDVPN